MARWSRRNKIEYRLDGLMSRGPGILVVGLFGATLVVVVIISAVIMVVGWGGESGFGPLDVIWRAFLTTLDPGTVGNLLGGNASAGFLFAMLVGTLFGIFVTSILIGILVTAIQGRLAQLRKGAQHRARARSYSDPLGWSPQILTILSELVVANANQRGSSIVVLAPRDKVEMEDDIRARVGATGHTKVVCRTGSPIDMTDLARVGIETAKSVIILPPDVEDPDADIIKTILAITNGPGRRPEPYHIVAGLSDRDSLEVARIVGKDEAQLVLVGDLIARIVAQTCRQSGLSVVYQELLDFEGDEIYEAEPPASLVGRPFRESLFAYDDSTVIGLMHADGGAQLNPPMEGPIEPGDRLLAISADDDTIVPKPVSFDPSTETQVVPPQRRQRAPERTLVLGWNRGGPSIAKELDAYVAPGSRIVVAATPGDLASAPMATDGLVNATLEMRPADTTKREALVSLCAEGFDHVIVLCSDLLDPQRADARTLVTLINLRDILVGEGYGFSITSEMLDLRNRALAEIARADDLIVSDRMVSLLLAQLSENAHLKAVFDDLFDAQGSEIYLRSASDYVQIGTPMPFATLLESAVRRGEIAIGYRQAASAADASRAFGVVVNPVKSRSVTFAQGDKVIVLAGAE
jgi:ion channel POLLUX/CASTOR